MMVTELLDKLPIWGIFLASLAITFVAIEFGNRLGKRKRERLKNEEKPHLGTVVAASLTLLVFMLAIVFSAVESRFNERKHIALDEANAIGTAYLRADLLPKADRADIQQLLYEYVTLRIEATQNGTGPKIKQAIDRSEALQSVMWSRAVTVADQQPTPISALFVQSLNEVFDMHAARITLGIHYRMQGLIWILLFSLALIAMIMGGYESGLSSRRHVIAITFLASLGFSVVLTLAIAMDRPWEQLSSVTQEAMIDVKEDIRSSMQSEQ